MIFKRHEYSSLIELHISLCVYLLQDLVANQVRVENINNLADKLSREGHPDQQLIESRKQVRLSFPIF